MSETDVTSGNPDEGKEIVPEIVDGKTSMDEQVDEKKIKVFSESSGEKGTSEQAEMMMAGVDGPSTYKVGDRVKGTIVQVRDDNLVVNIGTKNEGIVPKEELSFVPSPSTSQYSPGDEIDMIVIKQGDDDTYFLSKKRAEEDTSWKKVEEAHTNGTRIIAVGSQVVNAGLILDLGIRGFMPLSHSDIKRINVEDLIGKEFEVKILEFDRNSRPQRLVVSRRACLEEDLTKERDAIYDNFTIGDVVKGKVEKLTGFGAFINLGGVTGLLHISQMSRQRISDPSELVKVGEELEVKIIDVEKDKQKIRLSRRDLLPDPWEEADKKFKPDTVVEGVVVRVTSFGAFIKIDNYFEGLAHISELVDNKINHAKEVLSPGDKINVMILEIDKQRRRIRLSAKRALEKDARREVDAYLKQQGDIHNTLKIPLEGLPRMEDIPDAPKDEEKAKPAPVETEAKAEVAEEASPEPETTAEEPVTEPEAEKEPEPEKASEKPASAPSEEKAEEPAAEEAKPDEAESTPQEDAAKTTDSVEHSVDEEKDLLSGDELDDTGKPDLSKVKSSREESSEIDLVEGTELEDK